MNVGVVYDVLPGLLAGLAILGAVFAEPAAAGTASGCKLVHSL